MFLLHCASKGTGVPSIHRQAGGNPPVNTYTEYYEVEQRRERQPLGC